MKQISFEDLDYEEDGRWSYEDELFTGRATSFWANGRLCAESNYFEGLLDGETKVWYEQGTLKEEEFYKRGRVVKIRQWDENGQLRLSGEYEYDIPLWEKKWDEHGNLIKDFLLTEDHPRYKTLQMLRRLKKV